MTAEQQQGPNMTRLLSQVLLLVLVNYVSIFLIFIMFELSIRFGLVSMESIDTAADLFKLYSLHAYTTFFICALFSLSFLFLKSYWRYVFLLAPLVVPPAYGLFFLMHQSV